MREILFRGKRVDDGNWSEGYLIKDTNERTVILEWCEFNSFDHDTKHQESFEVIPETISQFTGLTDKNGVKIFEGDVLSTYGIEGNPVVYFDEQMACFRIKTHLKHHDGTSITFGFEETEPNSEIDVIDNIHDNPELLK